MAIKIRCQDCRKKISIDEAFAGGMCRCPYCKALVYVEDAAGGAGGKASARARPTAPSHRPAAPAQARPAAEAAAPSDFNHVPMARPVMIQGIITIVLLVLLVLMVGAGIAMAVFYLPGNGKVEPPPPPPPPTQPVNVEHIRKDVPAVVDIKIAPPVIHVLDGGSGMRSTLDSARLMVIKSVGSLGEGKFSVVFVGEGQDKVISPEFAVGGKAAAEEIGPILQEMIPSGAADLDTAIKAALDRKPKTIVLFTRKAVNDAAALAAKAKAQGAVIHTIVLDGDPEAKESLKQLAEDTGGQTRAFSAGEL